ncbi:RNA methyltransferase [Piscinibacter koreensis]|uniref:RNA methyltransferase n=1 Tax=Piscinibacter koreensis TaxID=2742824 RepID=UPI0031587833
MTDSGDSTRFVLVGTSHPGNIGAAARALKVMGFGDLVLVAPRFADAHRQAEAVAFASGATDVLERVRVVPTLVEALGGITFVCATAMTPRDFGPPTHAPRAFFPELAERAHRVAFVFGSERFGMPNRDVYACHACLSIPTAPDYGSLNLAQAVQLIAYEWRQALGGFELPRPVEPGRADAVAIDGLLGHWARALVRLGFLDPLVPRKLMPRLQQLANRAELTGEELHILRGVARAIERRLDEAEAGRPREG